MKNSFLLLGTAMLAACATSPDAIERLAYDRDALFATAPNAPDLWAARGVSGEAPQGDWLGQFGDPVMTSLVAEALGANPTLEARAASLRASAALARSSRARRVPNLSGSVTLGGNSAAIDTPLGTERFTDAVYGVGLDASWEPDLWGRVANSIARADADFAASAADYAAAELSIAAQTAIAWLGLNEALAQERIAVLTYEARDRARELTEQRVRIGLAGALELRTARSALAQAEAAIAARRQLSTQAARRLEVLLGRYPSAEITAPARLPELPPMAVQGNPALLLSRRPDIAASEARVVAAGLRAEEARLALLPSLRLTGSLSTSSSDIADALDPSLIAARLIGSFSQPIFNAGSLRAQQEAAIAQAQFAVANYASAALDAWREVENALTADILLAQQEDAQGRALEEARYAEENAERQYANGTVSIFNLIDTQTRRLTAESQLVSARADRAINRINYHLALGGGVPEMEFAREEDLFDTDAAESGRR
ncbi:efflux transporter outer membrane subunit [Hyphomonas sp.]|uniref:efflux transporter outer membrane subunit n=1 Tax=Hyphomonas sp. TaxID=87 RepID=UPI00391D68B9